MLKPVQNFENCNKLIKMIDSQSVVECRFPQTTDIAEIMAVHPQVSVVSCETASGRVNYSGKLVLTIVYSDEEGKLCRMQKGAEFSHYRDDDCLVPAQTGVCRLTCLKTSVKRDGSSFVISCVVSAQIAVYARSERAFVAAAEGAYLKTEEVNFSAPVCFSGESEVEEDFEADSVIDVLIPCAKAVVLSVVCGTGDVEISGEIYLSLFAMRQQSPVCLEKLIPFKCAVPCDDSSVGYTPYACVDISDLTVNCSVNEDRGKCNVNVVCDLSVNGWFADEHSAPVAQDAFSDSNALNINYAEECVRRFDGFKIYSERVSGYAAAKSKLGYDCKFMAAALPSAECAYNAENGCAEGAAACVLIYEQGGEIKRTEVELPFSVSLGGAAEKGQSVQLDVAVSGFSVRLRAEGEVEAEATVKICASVSGERTIRYISSMEEGEPLVKNDCAVSVILPAAGDGLWDIAKKLLKSPEDVVACNPELKFPLTGKERIVIYRCAKV